MRNFLARDPARGANRPKVLLLGISYPSVPGHMEKHGYSEDILTYKKPSVEQSVEIVRRGILTEMDGRDLARCVATEQVCGVDAYTVSKEIGAVYRSDRHLHGNFNARNFVRHLRKAFGDDIQFSQVILDYYWMPTGWLVTRWAKTLFQNTLPDLVRYNMLTYPSTRGRRKKRAVKDFDEGVVYLPFCAHVCKELVGAIEILEKYYAISFIKKSELSGHSLWKGTMNIDADVMQSRLGKRLDQEEVYCTFRPKDIYESMEDPHVSKPAVMRILMAIEDYDNIRMIRLRPLRQHEPPSVMKERLIKPEIGGFQGLNFNLPMKPKKAALKVKKGQISPGSPSRKADAKEKGPKKGTRARASTETQPTPKRKGTKQVNTKPKKRARKESNKAPVYEQVEEIPLSFLKTIPPMTYYFPGPTADLSRYVEPDKASTKEETTKTTLKKMSERSKSKREISSAGWGKQAEAALDKIDELPKAPSQYLSFNPRCKNPKRSRQHAKGPGSLVMDLCIPGIQELATQNSSSEELQSQNLDIKGACSLFGLRNELETMTCSLDESQELSCYKLPREAVASRIYNKESKNSSMNSNTVDLCENDENSGFSGILEAARGKWDVLLSNEDQQFLAKLREAIRNEKDSLKTSTDRLELLDNIVKWIVRGELLEDDLTGRFASTANALPSDESLTPAARAERIMGLLHNDLSYINSLKAPSISDVFDASIKVDFGFDNDEVKLYKDAELWLESEAEVHDPRSEFQSIHSKLPIAKPTDASERARELVYRASILRNMLGDWSSSGLIDKPQGQSIDHSGYQDVVESASLMNAALAWINDSDTSTHDLDDEFREAFIAISKLSTNTSSERAKELASRVEVMRHLFGEEWYKVKKSQTKVTNKGSADSQPGGIDLKSDMSQGCSPQKAVTESPKSRRKRSPSKVKKPEKVNEATNTTHKSKYVVTSQPENDETTKPTRKSATRSCKAKNAATVDGTDTVKAPSKLKGNSASAALDADSLNKVKLSKPVREPKGTKTTTSPERTESPVLQKSIQRIPNQNPPKRQAIGPSPNKVNDSSEISRHFEAPSSTKKREAQKTKVCMDRNPMQLSASNTSRPSIATNHAMQTAMLPPRYPGAMNHPMHHFGARPAAISMDAIAGIIDSFQTCLFHEMRMSRREYSMFLHRYAGQYGLHRSNILNKICAWLAVKHHSLDPTGELALVHGLFCPDRSISVSDQAIFLEFVLDYLCRTGIEEWRRNRDVATALVTQCLSLWERNGYVLLTLKSDPRRMNSGRHPVCVSPSPPNSVYDGFEYRGQALNMRASPAASGSLPHSSPAVQRHPNPGVPWVTIQKGRNPERRLY